MKIKQFKTKQKIVNYLRHHLNYKCELGKPIEDVELNELLFELVSIHYWSDGLIGCGVDYFFVDKCPVYPAKNKTFCIKRIDGSVSNFSYLKAIHGKQQRSKSVAKSAFRYEIEYQTKAFKQNFFAKNMDDKGYCYCEETGLKFTIKTSHVDHKFPKTFDSLYYAFLKIAGLKESDIDIDYNEAKDPRPFIKNRSLAELWKDWHKKNADLRCIFWRANLQGKRTKNFAGQQVRLSQITKQVQ